MWKCNTEIEMGRAGVAVDVMLEKETRLRQRGDEATANLRIAHDEVLPITATIHLGGEIPSFA